jgi:type IV secretory pathway VirB10-like protein
MKKWWENNWNWIVVLIASIAFHSGRILLENNKPHRISQPPISTYSPPITRSPTISEPRYKAPVEQPTYVSPTPEPRYQAPIQQPQEEQAAMQKILELQQQQKTLEVTRCISEQMARSSEAMARMADADSKLSQCETASCRDARRMEKEAAQKEFYEANKITSENLCALKYQ